MDYLKIGKASELSGKDRELYRALEIFPGFLSWATLLVLIVLSYFKPVWVAYFIIAFDVYWLLLVFYLGVHLLVSYKKLKQNSKVDWEKKCKELPSPTVGCGAPSPADISWEEVIHLVILPTYNESLDVIKSSFEGLVNDGYPTDKMIVVLATEERAGAEAQVRARAIEKEYGDKFRDFLITIHPGEIAGELKGKGANQAWAAREVKKKIIDAQNLDYDKILVSVFDIDTVVYPGYFYCLTYKFLTARSPYRASYQPVPVYHNNIWQAPFFARVAASSNTFWQMMQQIRQEKLATYSSHSMTWRALVDIDFWATNMVSEDSRIFWHCFLYYRGDYRVEPLYFPVSMDVCMDETTYETAKNLYKQQRRWGWGVENVPYLIFNFIKNWHNLPKRKIISRVLNQIYGFHSWATNALIIGVIGWLPLILGGDKFNITVLSGNLPTVTRYLMTIAMFGMVLSAIVSTMLLPNKPPKYGFGKNITMVLQWLILPLSIIVFGAIPALDAQTRLMLGKYMGFWVTPKKR
jgi:cellulose synthase/poly-beta-1,6-N-acetylglucosamine synthase-like glycosyltransferase